MTKFYIVAFLVFSGINSMAQSPANQLGNWIMYFGTNPISGTNLSLHTEYQVRLYEPLGELQQTLGRIGLNYHKNDHAHTIGVGRVLTNDYGLAFNENPIIENRIWQQFAFDHDIGIFEFEQRTRFEQRWIRDASTSFSLRARHRILVKYKLNQRFFLSAYDELFMAINAQPFDQNRLYGGLGFKLGHYVSLQSGFLRQTTAISGFNRLQFSITVNTHNKMPMRPAYKKPIIYLYPDSIMDVQVQLDYSGKLIHTYPQYVNGWKVTAHPDGTLIGADGKEYYALYWEGIPKESCTIKEGVVVPGNQTIEFLEKTLAELGLNRREANEFIIYWLPEMENNRYNLIHFSSSEYEETAKLSITPTPETMIRIMMIFQPLDEEVSIKKQDLSLLKKERKGFTVVEWGGQMLPQLTP
ncbi:MAG: DUF2490 domain-containing protein [Flavobacteriales bacterium]|nr:DUF2490 domain-containing protein [Flavobacteriales bacterium]